MFDVEYLAMWILLTQVKNTATILALSSTLLLILSLLPLAVYLSEVNNESKKKALNFYKKYLKLFIPFIVINIVLSTIIPSIKTLMLIGAVKFGPEYLERIMSILEGKL